MISIVIATVAVPALHARLADPRRALIRMLVMLLVFDLLYVGYAAFIHTSIATPVWRGW